MKLAHYQMLDAFQRRDIEEIYRLFKAQFKIDFDTAHAEVVVDDPYSSDEIILYLSKDFYSWNDWEGFYYNTFNTAIDPMLRIMFQVKQ